MASDIQSKAGKRWDKLENIFEERVAKAMGKLGDPSAKEVNALAARVEQLEKSIKSMNSHGAAAAKTTARPAAKSPAIAAVKTAAKSSTLPAARPAAKKAARPSAETSAAPAQ